MPASEIYCGSSYNLCRTLFSFILLQFILIVVLQVFFCGHVAEPDNSIYTLCFIIILWRCKVLHSCSFVQLIPPDFIKDFKKTMNEKVILKNVDGKKWYIDVKETEDGVFLKNGWQSFVDYHGLKVGEFLFFRYEGSYSFSVKILGTNGCKRDTFESKNIATPDSSEEETDVETEPKQTSRKRALPQNEDYLLSSHRRTKHSERLFIWY